VRLTDKGNRRAIVANKPPEEAAGRFSQFTIQAIEYWCTHLISCRVVTSDVVPGAGRDNNNFEPGLSSFLPHHWRPPEEEKKDRREIDHIGLG
jgi:hypothetical protein